MLAWIIGWLLTLAPSAEAAEALADASSREDESTTPRGVLVERRAWVQHVFDRHETLDEVAERYGVTSVELRQWNALEPDTRPARGQLLRIQARRFPRPRQRVRLKVRERDRWEDVARRYGVEVAHLKQWNARFARRRSPEGLHLHAWLDSRVAGPGSEIRGPTPPRITVRPDGVSIGRPHRGRLSRGVQLPESELYTVRHPRLAYGTSLAVLGIQQAIATFRHQCAFTGELAIGAMSRRTGRRLRPHRSHQSGRDVDIRLPALAFAEGEHRLSSQEVDWSATWALVQAFVRTKVVQVIFLERRLFRRLRRAARQMGASEAEIEDVIGGVVRHSKGHTSHIHVRFICSPVAEQCRD